MGAFLLLCNSFGWTNVARRNAMLACLGAGFFLLTTACGGRAGIVSEERPENGDGDGDGDGDGRHGDPCQSGEECGEGLYCVEGICVTSCVSGEECPSEAPTCHQDFGVCVACFGDHECPDGQSCRVGQCVGCSEGEWACFENASYLCEGDRYEIQEICTDGWTCESPEPSWAVCVPDPSACFPGESICSGQNRLGVCRSDGSGFDYQNCRQEGARCVEGACVKAHCEPNTLFCENGDVHLCSEDGFEDFLWASCGVEQTCVSEPDPSCQNFFCSPGSRGCTGEDASIAYLCNAAGTGYEATVPCEDVCVDGVCQNKICEPGTYSCNPSGDVALCSADGTTLTLADDCTASEYCEPGKSSCKAQVCSPQASWCAGQNVITCNENGSGSTVESCAPNDCVDGACQGATFSDDFEDGNYSGWIFQGQGYATTVTTGTAGDGSKSSVTMTGGNSGHYDGLYYSLPMPVQAERVSYWARQESFNFGTYFTLHDEGVPSTDTEIAFVYFTAGGNIAVGTHAGSLPVSPYQPGTWYHIELLFDWTENTYDILVDGALAQSDIGFRGENVDALARINLYHYSPGSTGYWDEIEFY